MRNQRVNLLLGLGLGVGTLLTLAAAPVAAQTPDSRWLPWLGCWQAEGAPADAGLLCVRPLSGQSSVEILRVSGTDVVSREVVWADGKQHETTREGCDGWEKGTFSRDGQRVYLSSDHVCEGGVERSGGGIMTLVAPDTWLDIRYVGMGDQKTPWVQRYQAASNRQAEDAGMGDIMAGREWSVRTARMNAASAPTVDDVIEASAQEPAEVVEAWVAERKAPMKLDAKALEKMADAGVSPDVIDIAVAVSFPSRFNVATRQPDMAAEEDYAYGRVRPIYFPWSYGYYDPFLARYGYYPYSSYFGYPYGYGGYYTGYYGGYNPVIVITNPNQGSPGHGRVIAGRGYTRGTGSTGSAGASSAPARSSTGSAARGSSGSRSSGSSSSGGRTAHRRGGGGGGL